MILSHVFSAEAKKAELWAKEENEVRKRKVWQPRKLHGSLILGPKQAFTTELALCDTDQTMQTEPCSF